MYCLKWEIPKNGKSKQHWLMRPMGFDLPIFPLFPRPQGLCTGCSLCLEHTSPGICLNCSLTSSGLCSPFQWGPPWPPHLNLFSPPYSLTSFSALFFSQNFSPPSLFYILCILFFVSIPHYTLPFMREKIFLPGFTAISLTSAVASGTY